MNDFPRPELARRAGRLLGAVTMLPGAARSGQIGLWLATVACTLFDLLGGPEAAEALWRRAVRVSPLTEAEIAAAAAVFGPRALQYQQVRVAEGGLLKVAFRLNKNRAFAVWHTVNLPGHGERSRANLSLLVHELTHVYQFERVGTAYIGQALVAQARLGRAAYDYGGPAGLAAAWAAGKRYRDYNREQQGQIAQDYQARLQSDQDTTAFEPFIADLRTGVF